MRSPCGQPARYAGTGTTPLCPVPRYRTFDHPVRPYTSSLVTPAKPIYYYTITIYLLELTSKIDKKINLKIF